MSKKENYDVPDTEILETPGIEQAAWDKVPDWQLDKSADATDTLTETQILRKRDSVKTNKSSGDKTKTYIIFGVLALILIFLIAIILGGSKRAKDKETTEALTEAHIDAADNEGAFDVINSYWDAYKEYDAEKMQKCFVEGVELTKHTQKEEDKKEEYGLSTIKEIKSDEFTLRADYTVTTGDKTEKGYKEATFKLIKQQGKYLIKEEPEIQTVLNE